MAESMQGLRLTSKDPMTVAKTVLKDCWTTQRGHPGLWRMKDRTWREWYGDSRWVVREDEQIVHSLWRVLGEALVETQIQDSEAWHIGKYGPDTGDIRDVKNALAAITEYQYPDVHRWLVTGKPDIQFCVAFEDVVVDVKGSVEKGEWVTVERDETFFSPVVVPCR